MVAVLAMMVFIIPQNTYVAPFDAANFMTLFFHKEGADADAVHGTLAPGARTAA